MYPPGLRIFNQKSHFQRFLKEKIFYNFRAKNFQSPRGSKCQAGNSVFRGFSLIFSDRLKAWNIFRFCSASPGPVTRSPCRSFSKVSDCRHHSIIGRPQQIRRFRRQPTGGSLYPYNSFQPFRCIRGALHDIICMTNSHFSHFVKSPCNI